MLAKTSIIVGRRGGGRGGAAAVTVGRNSWKACSSVHSCSFTTITGSSATDGCEENNHRRVNLQQATNGLVLSQHQMRSLLFNNNCIIRSFATEPKATVSKEEENEKEKENEAASHEEKDHDKKNEKKSSSSMNTDSLRDTVNRLKGESSSTSDDNNESIFSSFATATGMKTTMNRPEWLESFQKEVSATWNELLNAGKPQSINKKLHHRHPEATAEGEQEYDGPVDIMIIDPSENLTAWERMQRRLTEAPIIQNLLERSEEIYEKSGAKKAKQKVDHVVEDAKEVWETSQNPWVYRMSSVYDTLTADSPESFAVQKLRELDPTFTLENWRRDVVHHNLPQLMEWFLQGKINQLKPWLGDGVFQRIAAEIKSRESDGVEIDTHVLGIMNSEILACEIDEVNKGNSPIIVLHFMCQQINCVRKSKTGEIVEGSEDDIRANSYVAAFQREYDEENQELIWKIVDFRFNGAIAYI